MLALFDGEGCILLKLRDLGSADYAFSRIGAGEGDIVETEVNHGHFCLFLLSYRQPIL